MSLQIPRSEGRLPFVLSSLLSSIVPEDGQDIERLFGQQRLVHELMGGILPPGVSLPREGRVLDVGCGMGTWVYEMARRYPSLQVIGIDTNASCIHHARLLTRKLPNALFLLQDMHHLKGDIFLPGAFGLIHMRFLGGDISYQQFPELVQSLVRLLKVGGKLISCEAELPLTSSGACDFLEFLLLEALTSRGRAFAQGFALRVGFVAWIMHWLRQMGLMLEDALSYMLPVSYGTKAHEIFCQQISTLAQRLSPFLLASGVTSGEQCEEVCQQMQREIEAKTFEGVWPLHVVVAVKQELQAVQREMEQYNYADYREEARVSA